jgi:outer membrane usher protein FimD/PapC
VQGVILILEEKTMARRGWNLLLPVVVALLIAMPLAARDNAKNGKATTAEVELLSPASVSGKMLKPGTYRVTADDSKVTLTLNGKVVAEAPVEWKDETNKHNQSQIVTTDDQVKEIHFGGKMRYVAITG